MELSSVLTVEEAQANWTKLLRDIGKGRTFGISLEGEVVGIMRPPDKELAESARFKESANKAHE